MLTDNWYKNFATIFANGPKGIKCMAVDGTEVNCSTDKSAAAYLIPSNSTSLIVNSNMNGYGICFGDGNIAPTREDYFLSGNVITSLSRVSSVESAEVIGNTYKYLLTYTLKNTGSSDITISEVAWVVMFSKYEMVDRTLLDSPVTIPAGDIGVVVYTRSITIPS